MSESLEGLRPLLVKGKITAPKVNLYKEFTKAWPLHWPFEYLQITTVQCRKLLQFLRMNASSS